jgi:phosphoribosylformylglycinamidine cyclo-ligase
MLPDGVQAKLARARWPRPPIFDWLQQQGNVGGDEMHRVFNCGVGMGLVVAASDVPATIESLHGAGERAFDVGEIVARPDGAPQAIVA